MDWIVVISCLFQEAFERIFLRNRRDYYLNYASKIDLLRICCEYWRWINFENPWWKSGKSRFGNGLFSVEEDKTRGDRRGKSFRSAVARIACASLYLGGRNALVEENPVLASFVCQDQ